ncbi:molybdate ABC transporter substrate-binding protein [Chlorobium sp. N1]|uniref:molybdate ABC transporter substrate-binding protein n=1 Tax=Chlorobium sp. N1 TaxID=2491138 RepID=UPI00103B6D9A|nr:molybdate ABC transporter substrate-binding protein [Chlorobium sp. N1]TCD48832.1 molybdate ABC transporter substrate-binding protein [Chlorobium sp. N1]
MNSHPTTARGATLQRAALLLLLALTAAVPAMAGELRLSVAASLKDAVGELSANYTKKHPETTFRNNFAASGALAGQIHNGAPADIYISANKKWMAFLQTEKEVDPASVRILARNTLVFTGTASGMVTSMQDLATLHKIAIGSPKSVPAGQYAMEAITNAGMAGKLEGRLVMAKDVRECLMYAELGEVDGGFVYRTDALLAKKASIRFTVPRQLYPPVEYPMALTVAGAGNAEAVAFFAYLKSGEARRVLERYGFVTR